MTRFHVHVVHMRARDVRKGDVVARDPSRQDGWFRVHEVKILPDGNVNILDKGNVRGFLAGPFDLIGLQTPVPLPAEADVTSRRREQHAAPSDGPDGAASTAAPDGAIPVPAAPGPTATPSPSPDGDAREAAARTLQAEAQQVRGSLPQ